MRLVVYPGASAQDLANVLAAYQSMAERGAVGQSAIQAAAVHYPRPDRPLYVWLLESAVGPVGEVSLFNVDYYHSTAEIGIFTSKDCPKAIIGRAFIRACAYAFRDLGLRRLEAYVRASNRRAVRQCKKFGFRLEGVLRKAARNAKNTFDDIVVFGLLADEFEERWGGQNGRSGQLGYSRGHTMERLQPVPSQPEGSGGAGTPSPGDEH